MSSDTDGTQIVETLERLADAAPDIERYAIGAGIQSIKGQISRQLQLPPGALAPGRPPARRKHRPVNLDHRKLIAEMQRATTRKLESILNQ